MPTVSPGRPNVIVVLTDQQRWDTTGVHGNPLDLTPVFDEFARSGTHVAQAVTPNPVCAPARASLQTGMRGTTTGCYRNNVPLPSDSRTLAHYFGDAGYKTGYIGKWHLASSDPVPPEERGGYESWLAANALEFTSDAYRTIMFDDAGEPVMLPGYRSDAVYDAAIRFVADNVTPPGAAPSSVRPFFLFISQIEPHHQNEVDTYPAPTGYAERYDGRWMPRDLAALSGGPRANATRHLGGYCGQIRRVDEGLGRLFDALRSMDVLDDTIVAFTSDHGNHFKTRNEEYKRSCHDSSVRVPLAVRGPGFDGGGRLEQQVTTMDLPPTLLEAAGIAVPDAMQGRSFLPLVRGDDEDWPDESFIQVSESGVARAIRTSRWKYCVLAPDADGWDDAGAAHYVEAELYDLRGDPHELENLAGSVAHRGVADDLRERLIGHMVDAGEAKPMIDPAQEVKLARMQRVDPFVWDGTWAPTRYAHQPRPPEAV
jgi:arylsulfatase A-like enzyme